MIAVVQRVCESSVHVNNHEAGKINNGLLVLLGVNQTDKPADAEYLAKKIPELRIFDDQDGKMNLSLIDTGGELLVVSQFTLLGDCRKGRRPSYVNAAPPDKANELYEYFISLVKHRNIKTETGQFQAMMEVSLINDGPVTLIIDSNK